MTKVQGHIYVVPSRINDLVPHHRLAEISPRMNVTHTINQFSFGDDMPVSLQLALHSYSFVFSFLSFLPPPLLLLLLLLLLNLFFFLPASLINRVNSLLSKADVV